MTCCYYKYIGDIKMKKCSVCLEIKANSEYDAQRTQCKSCRNKQRAARAKKYYPVSVETKTCRKCGETKSHTEFGVDPSRTDGLHAYCKSCRSKTAKNDYVQNRESKIESSSNYYRENKTKVIKSQNKRVKVRLKADPKFLLKRRLRNRLYCALRSKGWGKNNKFKEYIGCTQDELKMHIEKQFTFGMSWENAGQWHIDHVKPLSSAQTEQEMYELCHYTNLQPMWALDNIRKGNK
jgi:hypothetical protein